MIPFPSMAQFYRWRTIMFVRIGGQFCAVVAGKRIESGRIKLLVSNYTLNKFEEPPPSQYVRKPCTVPRGGKRQGHY